MTNHFVLRHQLLLAISCQIVFACSAMLAVGQEPDVRNATETALARYQTVLSIRGAVELGSRRQYKAALSVLDSVDEHQRHWEHRFLTSYYRSISVPSAGPVVPKSLSLERIEGDTTGRVSKASFDHRYVCLQTIGGGLGLWNRRSNQIHTLVIPNRSFAGELGKESTRTVLTLKPPRIVGSLTENVRVAFSESPDGPTTSQKPNERFVAVATHSNSLYVFDCESGKYVGTIGTSSEDEKRPTVLKEFAIRPDGIVAVLDREGNVFLADPSTDQLLLSLNTENIVTIQFGVGGDLYGIKKSGDAFAWTVKSKGERKNERLEQPDPGRLLGNLLRFTDVEKESPQEASIDPQQEEIIGCKMSVDGLVVLAQEGGEVTAAVVDPDGCYELGVIPISERAFNALEFVWWSNQVAVMAKNASKEFAVWVPFKMRQNELDGKVSTSWVWREDRSVFDKLGFFASGSLQMNSEGTPVITVSTERNGSLGTIEFNIFPIVSVENDRLAIPMAQPIAETPGSRYSFLVSNGMVIRLTNGNDNADAHAQETAEQCNDVVAIQLVDHGNRLAVVTRRGTLQLWDPEIFEMVTEFDSFTDKLDDQNIQCDIRFKQDSDRIQVRVKDAVHGDNKVFSWWIHSVQ